MAVSKKQLEANRTNALKSTWRRAKKRTKGRDGEPTKTSGLRNKTPAKTDGQKQSIETAMRNFWMAPVSMTNVFSDDGESAKEHRKLMRLTKNALVDTELQTIFIDNILAEVVVGAYQDRVAAYYITPAGAGTHDIEALARVQRLRHKADLHLIRAIQSFVDIRRPPVQVVVRQAGQVNVAEKQINVEKGEQSGK